MKVLVYADGRSLHTEAWLEGLRAAGIDAYLASSMPPGNHLSTRSKAARALLKLPLHLQQLVRTSEAIWRAPKRRQALRIGIREFAPDLVHALRLPYEGVTALSIASEFPQIPVAVSTWGQDFVPQAASDIILRAWIRRTLPGAAGLHVDAVQDIARAKALGFPSSKPNFVAAGNFGVDSSRFYPVQKEAIVLYPRGIRGYVDHTSFLTAAAKLINQGSVFTFMCIGPGEHPWMEPHDGNPRILSSSALPREEYAALLRRTSVVVSPSTSDGMPNTILESIAAGTLPVVGRLPQLLALTKTGSILRFLHGLGPDAIADAISAIEPELLSAALEVNPRSLPPEYRLADNRFRVPRFYEEVIAAHEEGAVFP